MYYSNKKLNKVILVINSRSELMLFKLKEPIMYIIFKVSQTYIVRDCRNKSYTYILMT